ncbi:MAG: serine hydrolase [Gemmatimonadota bacterium]
MRRCVIRPAYLTFLSLLAACGPEGPVDPPPPAAEQTVVLASPVDTLISLDETAQLTVTVTEANGTAVVNPSVNWASSAPGTVSVTAQGEIRARDSGSALISATVGGASDTLEITVFQKAASIQVTGLDTVFNVGVRTRFSVTAVDALGNTYTRTPLEWTTSDPGVATVESTGLVLPLAAGAAVVSVRAGDDSGAHTLAVVPDIALQVNAALAEALQWTFEDSLTANGVIGASAAVVIPGVGTWRGVFGRSGDTDRIRPNMMFPTGSISKMVVSSLMLDLVDDGLVGLDDTVGQWLPPFSNPNISPGISIRQLMQNTSGLHSHTSNQAFTDSVFADQQRVWTPDEIMEMFVLEPVFAPGTSWKSSGTGYVLVGMIAEAVTGELAVDLYRNRLFNPMGLAQATLGGFEAPPAPAAVTWNGLFGGPFENFTATYLNGPSFDTAIWVAFGTKISAGSLAEFGTQLFGDFLSPAIRADMLTTVPDDGGIPGQVAGGLGVREYNYLGRRQFGHSGAQVNGGGFLVWDEDSGITIAILYNQNGSSHQGSHFRLVPQLLSIALTAAP